MRPASSPADRNEMCRLAALGLSANAIAIETGWAASTVRLHAGGALTHPRHRRVDLDRHRRFVRAYDDAVAGRAGTVEGVAARFGLRSADVAKVTASRSRRRLLEGVTHDAMPRLGPSASEGDGR